MQYKRVLILEDDLETVSILFNRFARLENELMKSPKNIEFSISLLSEYSDVEDLINNLKADKFDIILLDRDCKIGGSFHILNIEKFGIEKVISISSTPPYNEEAKKRGVTRVVHKDYSNLETFADSVMQHVRDMV